MLLIEAIKQGIQWLKGCRFVSQGSPSPQVCAKLPAYFLHALQPQASLTGELL